VVVGKVDDVVVVVVGRVFGFVPHGSWGHCGIVDVVVV
jgi:hypothetical protein